MNILGTGHYLPQNIMTNDHISQLVDTSDTWISSRTGIRKRHISGGENTSDLAVQAALKTFENSGIQPAEIELVIVATTTPDSFVPGVAHQVLKRLQIPQAMAFDINAACTGFIYALDTAAALMEARNLKRALVIGSEVLSKIVDWTDRNTCVLFGDGAGAVILGHEPGKKLLYAKSTALPDMEEVLYSGGLAVNNPLTQEEQTKIAIGMKGQEVFKFAVSKVSSSIKEGLEATGLTQEDIAYFVLHQANQRILDFAAKRLEIPEHKIYSTIEYTGNTSAASIPITLDEMNQKGLLKKGMKLVLSGFGAGLTYGMMLIEW